MHKLTPTEQNDLATKAKNGDRRAQAALLAFCDRDIRAIVAKLRGTTAEEREDLAQVGRMAVLESAIPNFDSTKGLQFRFYAAVWVRTEVRRSRNVNSSVVVINTRTMGADVCFDTPVSEEDGLTWNERLESGEPTPEQALATCQESERVRQVMESIISRLHADASARYNKQALCRDVVYDRLLAEVPVGLDIIAQRFGVARETVRKHETLILNRLARALEAT